MEEKNRNHLPLDEEKVLEFEVAKDLTIEEAVKKHKEIEAGVTEDDGLLDRYIKQHREEIESQKFETKVNHLPLVEAREDALLTASEAREDELSEETIVLDPIVEELSPTPLESLEETVVAEAVVMDDLHPVQEDSDGTDEQEEDEQLDEDKKMVYFWSAAGLLFVGLVATAFIWMNSVNQSKLSTEASSTSSSQVSSSSSSSTDANAVAFEQLYQSFFTDSSLTKLKNSEFGKLPELKNLLEKMAKDSDVYKKAKVQYDNLEKAIAAIQAMNAQFDKEVIVDGEIDTTATVKAATNLTASTTGIGSVDSLLASVVNFGRTQLENASTGAGENQTAGDGTAETQSSNPPSVAEPTNPPQAASQTVSGTSTDFGIEVPAGVSLQRDRSRVPYNQTMIDDASNEAWVFNPGILENIVSISQQRGYITGNQFILEKVNIINGNGYYNMFKPDGTYLFSINCKTGYFVGNGAGYSDDLDY